MSTSSNRKDYSKGENALRMKDAIAAQYMDPLRAPYNIAKAFGVDRKALYNRLEGKITVTACLGRNSYLNNEDEIRLVSFLTEVASLGFGFSINQLRYSVRAILNKDPAKITRGWYYHFMKKHPELTIRRTEALDRLRVRAVDQSTIQQYFDVLGLAFEKCKELSKGQELLPNRIFAMDETGIAPNQKQRFVVCKRGERSVFSICSENREHMTIIGAASACGWSVRPAFILLKKINNFLGNTFPNSLVEVTSTGYINDPTYVIGAELSWKTLRLLLEMIVLYSVY